MFQKPFHVERGEAEWFFFSFSKTVPDLARVTLSSLIEVEVS